MITRHKAKSVTLIVLCAAILVWAGCQDSPTRLPYPEIPTTVEVTPPEVTMKEIGVTTQLTASVRNNIGDEIKDASVVWTSSNDDVVRVGEGGLVEAVGEGTADVVAESGHVSGKATVEVKIDEAG